VSVHPTAVVDPRAELREGVTVGPFAVIGAGAVLGAGTRVGAHAIVEGNAEIGEACELHPFSAVGGPPQDRKYRDEPTRVVLGRGVIVREGVTVHRGTVGGGGVTRVGDGVLLMAQSHVAHDVQVGARAVLANGVALAGHVVVGEGAVFGGLSAVHQHARVGRLAMIGGGAMVAQDVPPFCGAQGDRARIYGLNREGLRRAGIPPERVAALALAFRVLFREGGLFREKLLALETGAEAEVAELLAFCRASTRGVCRARGAEL
jgi:UDP-N-acetylglucosamine acyltransferase